MKFWLNIFLLITYVPTLRSPRLDLLCAGYRYMSVTVLDYVMYTFIFEVGYNVAQASLNCCVVEHDIELI